MRATVHRPGRRAAAMCVSVAALLLVAAGESSAQRQRAPSLGQRPDTGRRGTLRSMIRFINKLSGPGPFVGGGLDVGYSFDGLRLGFPVSVLRSVDPDTPVTLATAMATVDFAYGRVELGSGFGVYRFTGGGMQPLNTYPVRQSLAYRFPAFSGRVQAHVAANIFRGFDDSEFAPLDVQIAPRALDIVPEVGLSIELLPGVSLGPASRSASRLLAGILTIAATTGLKYAVDRNDLGGISVKLP